MDFNELWQRHQFELPTRDEGQVNVCVYARTFSIWAEELCLASTQNPSIVTINQNLILLVTKYMDWRTAVPKKHRSYTGSSHTCIFHIFETAYNRLKVLELALTPPMLFLPPPPPPPPAPPPPSQIAGVFLGELDEE